VELIEKYPNDKILLLEYIRKQKELYKKLTDEIISVIFVMKKKV
jgi:hypothetical protein